MVTKLDDPPLRLLLGRDVLKGGARPVARVLGVDRQMGARHQDVNFPILTARFDLFLGPCDFHSHDVAVSADQMEESGPPLADHVLGGLALRRE